MGCQVSLSRTEINGQLGTVAEIEGLSRDSLPVHLAVIMDGNGRWERRQLMQPGSGHKQGAEAARRVVTFCRRIGIPILTMYAFSLENWSRPDEEVDALMQLLVTYLDKEVDMLMDNDVRLNPLGRLSLLPKEVREKLLAACEATAANKGMLLNLAISYGGRAEVVDAARRIARDVEEGKLCSSDINERLFAGYLYTANLPDPDLLIRTGGEMRISNFLLWQTAYTEIYVSEKLWPDFDENDLCQALLDFKRRERRFGLTSEQSVRRKPCEWF